MLHQLLSNGSTTIVDWVAPTEDVWARLSDEVAAAGLEPLEIRATHFSDGELDVLRGAGFTRADEPDTEMLPAPGVFLLPLRHGDQDALGDWTLDHLSEPERWDVHMLDSDAY